MDCYPLLIRSLARSLRIELAQRRPLAGQRRSLGLFQYLLPILVACHGRCPSLA